MTALDILIRVVRLVADVPPRFPTFAFSLWIMIGNYPPLSKPKPSIRLICSGFLIGSGLQTIAAKELEMTKRNPVTDIDLRYGEPDATATPWSVGSEILKQAELYWITTVRPEGRPHTVPLMGIWLDDTFYISTGQVERKARNLESNQQVTVTTGCNRWEEGFDVVVEGRAVRLKDQTRLQLIADAYKVKYGWTYTVVDEALEGERGNTGWVFKITPVTAFGFAKKPYSQTRWRFSAA